jgi:hypothetical protein
MMLANTDFTEKGIILVKYLLNFIVTQFIVDDHLSMKFTCGIVLTGRHFNLSLKVRS